MSSSNNLVVGLSGASTLRTSQYVVGPHTQCRTALFLLADATSHGNEIMFQPFGPGKTNVPLFTGVYFIHVC